MDYHNIEWFALEQNRDHSVALEDNLTLPLFRAFYLGVANFLLDIVSSLGLSGLCQLLFPFSLPFSTSAVLTFNDGNGHFLGLEFSDYL